MIEVNAHFTNIMKVMYIIIIVMDNEYGTLIFISKNISIVIVSECIVVQTTSVVANMASSAQGSLAYQAHSNPLQS